MAPSASSASESAVNAGVCVSDQAGVVVHDHAVAGPVGRGGRDPQRARRAYPDPHRGNTDSRGNDAANLKLSQDRASAVCDYLSSRGVQPGRLAAVGYGETHPLVKETDDASQSKNRRVDFLVVDRSDNDVNAEMQKIDVSDNATKPDPAPKGQ
ncbi:MAG: OmpA family protein [Myxococcales bacterium]|nr:OmpA family protein [Myxococcales bacterium]